FTRLQRGAGRPMVERIAYVTDQAIQQLSAYAAIILAGAPPPVSFFGHPDRPSVLTSESTEVFALAEPEQDCAGALMALAELVGAAQTPPQVQAREGCSNPTGDITAGALAAAVAASLPDNTIVVDESITSGRGMMAATAGAAPHDWLVNTGGSIGIGMPLSVGAAVACPDRPVLCLEADGSGMYTLQALWTAARENLNITVVVFANRAYAILKGELANAGLNAGPKALDMLDIGRPDIDWVMLAQAMGVPATRAANLESFAAALRSGLTSGGPNLIELPL
ncbi:MAG: acetolactate synthase large subunit, partial [Alphaproteobacteria bacterium]|nr:acetolactate synthase large subunit [Alphaproteobacteria bacterium]